MSAVRRRVVKGLFLALSVVGIVGGCHHFEITAVSLSNPCEPEGLPFYLPKPLLIIAKNFRNIEERTDGLTDPVPIPNSFDQQQGYADLKANVTTTSAPSTPPPGDDAKKHAGPIRTPDGTVVQERILPSEAPKDGASPDTFFTYHIVFVPDLTQKYGLRVKGGPGEVRAALNLVNGWMFTGLGPFYLKDSSTAQNIMAGGAAVTLAGRGVADVVSSLADLRRAGLRQAGQVEGSQLEKTVHTMTMLMDEKKMGPAPLCIPRYAEIHIYEPVLTSEHTVEWRPVVNQEFERTILTVVTKVEATYRPRVGATPDKPVPGKDEKKDKKPELVPAPKPGEEPPTLGGQPGSSEETQTRQAGPITETQLSAPTGLVAVEQGIADRMRRVFGGGQVTAAALTGRQAGPVAAPAAAGPGNNVTVNVNPWHTKFGCLWPFECLHKKKHVQTQEAFISSEFNIQSAGTGVSAPGTMLGSQPRSQLAADTEIK
jgi:hypothetical protein